MLHSTAPGAGLGAGARESFWRLVAAALLGVVLQLLAACGGGGGGGGSSPPPAIQITAQPADVHAVDGTAAVFSVGVQGDADLQWQRGAGGAWTDVPGAIAADLSLGTVHVADSGQQFRVRVTNRHAATDQLVSSVVTLTVDAAVASPAIAVQPQDVAAYDGQDAAFSLTASGSSLTYRWQRSDDGSTWTDVPQAAAPMLQLVATLADNNVQFRAIASNAAGSVTSAPARLVVRSVVAAVFSLDPVDTAVIVGQGATFTAQAVGTPAPSIAWQTSANGVDWADVPEATSGSLVLPATTSADAGKWVRAVATNFMGSVQSARAQLTVLSSGVPLVRATPLDSSVTVGMDASFSVDAVGVPSVSYQWQVSSDGTSFANVNGGVGKILTVPHVAAGDDGKLFRVVVSNSAGSTTTSAGQLHVIAPPTITLQPTYATWRPGVTDALFTVAASGSSLQYQWQSSVDGGTTWSDIAGATGTSYLHAAAASTAVDAVRVVVSNSEGSTTSAQASLTALRWAFVGPRPTGAALLAAAWVDATTVVAAGAQGTIVRSTDAGASWQLVSESVWTDGITPAVAFDGQGHGVAPRGGASGNLPVKRSADGGLHWVEVDDGRTNPVSSGIAAAAYSNNGAFCLAGNGGIILRSTDAGLSWQRAVTDGTTASLSALAFNADGVGLAVGDGGTILRSVNGGANWARVATGSQAFRSAAFASRTTAFAGGDNGALLRSDDGGQTWTPVASGLTDAIMGLQFRDASHGALTLSQGSVRVTSDGGASWTLPAIASATDTLEAVSFGPGSNVVAVGEDGTVYRSGDDGLHWTSVAHGGLGESLYAVAFGSTTNGVAVGALGRVTRSGDGGATWAAVASATTANLNAAGFFGASTGVALGDGGKIVRTTDGGGTWASATSGTTDRFVAVGIASSSVGVASTDLSGLLRTRDAGITWAPVASAAATVVRGLAFRDALVGLAVGDQGRIQRTTDGGLTWTTVSSGGTQSLFAVTFATPDLAIAVGQGALLMRSTDGGATWQSGLVDDPFYGYGYYGVTFVTPSLGFAVGDYGTVRVTHDGGLTWATDYSQQSGQMTGIAAVGSAAVVTVGFGGIITRDDAF